MLRKDYFRILGIARCSGPEEVKRAYRELAFRYHPDTSGGGQEAAERFREIREAYDVLSNSNSRIRHERELDSHRIPVRRSSPPSRTSRDFDTGDFVPFARTEFIGRYVPRQTRVPFSGPFDGLRGRHTLRGQGFCDFPLTAAEARDGTERDLRIDMPHETIRITVETPPGVEEGSLLEVVGPLSPEGWGFRSSCGPGSSTD